MSEAIQALQQLSDVASGDLTGPLAEEALIDAANAVQQLRSTAGWSALQSEDFSAVALTRALGDILKSQEASLRSQASGIYACLLSLPDAPVGTLCEPYAFAAFVHCLKSLCLPAGKEAQQGAGGGTQQDEDHAVSPLVLVDDLAAFLKQHSMRGSPEMFGLLLDALVDLTASTLPSGAKQDKPGKRGGAAGRNQGASVAEAAFALLTVAMDGRHGDVAQTAALVFHRLVPTLLAPEPGKRGSQGLDRRGTALNLINKFIRANDAARPCRLAVMRQLCLRVPDKADCRQLAVTSVQSLVPECSAAEIHTFCLFLYRLSRTQKTGNRLVAVELAGALLSTLPTPFAATGVYQRLLDGSCGAGDELDAPWSALCLAIVVGRSNDKSASVRCKSMACLAECSQAFAKRLQDASEGGTGAGEAAAFVPALCASRQIRVQVKEPRGTGAGGEDASEDGEDEQEGGQDAQARPPPEAQVSATIPGRISLDLTWMATFCHARCRDEKAAVRKAALQLLESVLELCAAVAAQKPAAQDGKPAFEPTAQDVQVLEEATADSLVSVRKTALQVVCSLVSRYPQHSGLAGVWARCVLPMVRDPESAVQDVVLDRLSQLLLDPLAALGSKGGGGRGRAAVAQQNADAEVRQRLAALAQMGRAASSCLGKALGVMSAKKLLRGPQVAAGLEAFLSAGRQAEPMAAAAGGVGRGRSAEAEREREQRLALRDQREGAWMLLVEVAGQDPSAPSWQFLQRSWGELQAAGAGASAQEGAMLLWVISHAASRFPAADASNLSSGLLQAIMGFNLPCAAVAAHLAALHKLTEVEGGSEVVGPPSQWCAKVLEASEQVLAQAMEARGNLNMALATRCQLALFTLGEVALLRETRVSGGAAVKVQALTSLRPGGAAGGSGQAAGSAAVSAHAWTCLGKLCMVDEGLAKKCVPLLVQEMSGSPSPVVRTNLLVGLSDMVVQFTGLADAYVGRLAAMVRDPHELVRRQALALLANLLLRDFVKWRGALVHRFLLALVDESPGVRQLAQYLLSDSLAAKAPMLAYNHFIESLFVLNDCSAGLHGSRAGGGSSDLAAELALHSALEGAGFHLKGNSPIMRAKRDIIYCALLRRMSPEHRFAASAKLVAEILGGVVDGLLPLPEADEVLGDALRLLACKDMKVNSSKFGAPAEEDGAEPPTGMQEDVSKARGKLVGAMMKRHLVESVVPIMVELRYMLQAQKHPLLGSLMLCMASLLRDYKSEVEDILVADKQLAREIMHDLKHYESLAKQQQQQQEAAMAAALKPSNRPADTGAPSAAAAAQRLMPPPPVPGDRHRRQTAVLPGVEPSRTPVAAEVLATAAKRRQGGPSLSRHQTPNGAIPAWDLAGAADAAAAGAKTPAAALQGVGAGAGTAMRTPHTGLLGTAQRGLPPAGMAMPSPAPLSARARAQQQPAPHIIGVAAAPSPRLAARARAGPSTTVQQDDAPLTVILPSPMPDAQHQRQPRPLGPHNADGAGPSQPPNAADKQTRTPPAAVAAAVLAARKAAAEAAPDGAGVNTAPAPVGAGNGAVQLPGGAAPRERHGDRGDKHGKAVKVKQEVKEEPLEVSKAGVGVKAEAPEELAGRSRASKRRHD